MKYTRGTWSSGGINVGLYVITKYQKIRRETAKSPIVVKFWSGGNRNWEHTIFQWKFSEKFKFDRLRKWMKNGVEWDFFIPKKMRWRFFPVIVFPIKLKTFPVI
jgi:hypothetical protein